MLIVGAVESGAELDETALVELLSSNLCRCTGYQNIVKAARSVLETTRGR